MLALSLDMKVYLKTNDASEHKSRKSCGPACLECWNSLDAWTSDIVFRFRPDGREINSVHAFFNLVSNFSIHTLTRSWTRTGDSPAGRLKSKIHTSYIYIYPRVHTCSHMGVNTEFQAMPTARSSVRKSSLACSLLPLSIFFLLVGGEGGDEHNRIIRRLSWKCQLSSGG